MGRRRLHRVAQLVERFRVVGSEGGIEEGAQGSGDQRGKNAVFDGGGTLLIGQKTFDGVDGNSFAQSGWVFMPGIMPNDFPCDGIRDRTRGWPGGPCQ